MLEKNWDAAKCLDRNATIFHLFHHSFDEIVYHQQHSEGIGTNVQHTRPFGDKEEGMLPSRVFQDCVSPTFQLHRNSQHVAKMAAVAVANSSEESNSC